MIILEHDQHLLWWLFPICLANDRFHVQKMMIPGCNLRFDVSDKIIQIIVNFVRLPIVERVIDVLVRRSFSCIIGWVLNQFPSFVVNWLNSSMFDMWTSITMVKHDVILLARTCGFDSDFQAIELKKTDVTVNEKQTLMEMVVNSGLTQYIRENIIISKLSRSLFVFILRSA